MPDLTRCREVAKTNHGFLDAPVSAECVRLLD
jgi:hypothetical protein